MRRRVVEMVAMACVGALGVPAAAAARIAYVVGTRVWIADNNGMHRHMLGRGALPLISPNGRFVAVRIGPFEGNRVVIYDGSGRVVRRFAPARSLGVIPLAWSPDSRYFAINNMSDSGGLDLLDVQAGSARLVSMADASHASFAPGLPDRLVYDSDNGIYMSRSDGSGQVQLTHGFLSGSGPVWGRSGIAFARQGQIWMTRPDGSHQRQVTHIRKTLGFAGLESRYGSATGTRLIADSLFANIDAPPQPWRVSLRSGHGTHITVPGRYVALGGISRDGTRILIDAYTTASTDGEIATMAFNGGPIKVLIRHGYQPSWTG